MIEHVVEQTIENENDDPPELTSGGHPTDREEYTEEEATMSAQQTGDEYPPDHPLAFKPDDAPGVRKLKQQARDALSDPNRPTTRPTRHVNTGNGGSGAGDPVERGA